MRYLLGSESEAIDFVEAAIHYRPAGTVHAVDPGTVTGDPAPTVGYAVCGTPVRIWAERDFDPHAENACTAACHELGGGHAEPESAA